MSSAAIKLLHADSDGFTRLFGQALYDEYAALFGLETEAPTLDRLLIINGETLQGTFSRNVTHNEVPTLTGDSTITATYSSGTGTRTINWTLSRTAPATEEVTADFAAGAVSGGGVDIEAVSGHDCIHKLHVAHGTAPGGGTQHESMLSPFRNGGIRSAQTGDWSDTNSWVGGVVPAATDYVLIESGHVITVDTTGLEAKGILIAGKLTASRVASHSLKFTTIATLSGGELNWGNDGDIVPAAVTSEWIIRNEALPDQMLDPFQFSNGIVTLSGGKRYVHGAVKTVRARDLRTAAVASAAATALTMATEPGGWAAGDTVILPPTDPIRTALDFLYNNARVILPDYDEDYHAGRDPEEFAIDSISTTTVNVTSALQADHLPAYDKDDADPWYPHLMNLTRNVVIRSESAAGVLGHILDTGAADVRVRYCELRDLGRTQDGFNDLDDTVYDEDTGTLTSYGTNQRGRYAFHAHHLIGPATDPDVTTLTFGGTPNGGTFTIVYETEGGRVTTAAISWDATGATLASNIQAALDALHGASAVVVTGTGPFTLTSAGTVLQPVAVLNNLTGTEPTVNAGYQWEFEGNSIRNGGRWAAAIHGSSFGYFKSNHIFEAIAAGVSFEDGSEFYNVIEDNIVCRVRNDGNLSVANGMWGFNFSNVFNYNVVSCLYQGNSDGVQDIDDPLPPYLGHGYHFDFLGRDGFGNTTEVGGTGDVRAPRSRGADMMHGTEGVDYRFQHLPSTHFIRFDNNEGYALLKVISFDHAPGEAGNTQHITNLKAWGFVQDPVFIYGGGGMNFQIEDSGFRRFWGPECLTPNDNRSPIRFVNCHVHEDDAVPNTFGDRIGIVHRGAAHFQFLIFETVDVYAMQPIVFARSSFSGAAAIGQGPPDNFFPARVSCLIDCTLSQPVASTHPKYQLRYGSIDTGSVQDPMALEQWFVDNLDDDGRLLQLYNDDEQHPDSIAPGPAAVTGYACPENGLTNQQCFDTYERATGGELAPTSGTTTHSSIDDAIIKEVATLAVTGVVSTATRTTISFNRRVSDTDFDYLSPDAFHEFAGFALNAGAAVSLYYLSGEYEDELVFVHSRHLSDAEALTIDYTAGTVGIWPIAELQRLGSFSGTAVTNTSTAVGGDPNPFTAAAVLDADLDDDNTWADNTANSIDGTETGTVTVADSAAVFAGDGAEIAFNDALLDSAVGSGAYSLIVWASWDEYTSESGAGDSITMLAKRGATANYPTVQITREALNPTQIFFEVTNTAGATSRAVYDLSADEIESLEANPTQWQMFCLRVDGTDIDCFRGAAGDLSEGTSATFSGSHDGASGDLILGHAGNIFGGDPARPYTGKLKRLEVYDRALSDDEIVMRYGQGSPSGWPHPDMPVAGGTAHLISNYRDVISGAPISA